MNNLTLNLNSIRQSTANAPFDNGNSYYFVPKRERRVYVRQPEPLPAQADELEVATTAGGAAIMLRLAQYGLEKLSGVCSAALMAGKEFATREEVEKVADAMKKNNGLSADIYYLDGSNTASLKHNFPTLTKSLDVVAEGRNAFYTDKGNFACAPKSKPSLILHELGHATNFEKSAIMKSLQKLRVVGMFAPMTIAFLNNVSGRRRDGKKSFWERNAGTIGFCAFMPTIIEEAAASIRGINAAKKTLGKNANLGALKKNYFLAWMTYVLAGIGTGIAAKLMINND